MFAAATLTTLSLAQSPPVVRGIHLWGFDFSDRTDVAQFNDVVDVSQFLENLLVLRASGEVAMISLRSDIGRVPAFGAAVTKVAIGPRHGAALLANGRIETWSRASIGVTPVPPLPAGVVYVDVESSDWSVMALRSDGSAVAWGGRVSGPFLMSPPAGVQYTDIAIRSYTRSTYLAAALRSDGLIDVYPTPGSGNTYTPPALPPGTVYTKLGGAAGAATAIRSDGALVTFGGILFPDAIHIPPPGVSYTDAASADSRRFGVVATLSDGTLVQIPPPGSTTPQPASFPPLPPGVQYTKVTQHLSGKFGAALRSDGRVQFWGEHLYLVDSGGPTNPRSNPVVDMASGLTLRVSGELNNSSAFQGQSITDRYSLITGIGTRVLGLRADGRVMTSFSTLPAQPALPSGVGITSLLNSSGSEVVALRSDGIIDAWGGAAAAPALPPGLRYVDLGVLGAAEVAVRSDGQLVAWGGSSTGTLPTLPVGRSYLRTAPGYMAILDDGTLIGWNRQTGASLGAYPAPPTGATFVDIETMGGGSSSSQPAYVARASDGSIYLTPGQSSLNGSAGWRRPPPGSSFVRVFRTYLSASTPYRLGLGAELGSESTYVTFGAGCAGSQRAARLIPEDTPRIGATFGLRVLDLPNDTAFLVTGSSATSSRLGPLPLFLGAYGMPGCQLHVSLDAVDLVVGTNGVGAVHYEIPRVPAFLGTTFYQQALIIDTSAPNAAGAVASEAKVGQVGQ